MALADEQSGADEQATEVPAVLKHTGTTVATKTIKYVNFKIPLQTIIMHVVYQIVLFYLILNSEHSFVYIASGIERTSAEEKAERTCMKDTLLLLAEIPHKKNGPYTYPKRIPSDMLLVRFVYTPYYT